MRKLILQVLGGALIGLLLGVSGAASGGITTQITNDSNSDYDPAVSGSNVVWASSKDGDSEIYFGYGPSIMIADSADLSLNVLENVAYTDSGGTLVSSNDRDEVIINAMLMTDIALRHTVAWAVLDDVRYGA
ncbi:MAG: hypothetical protein JJE42_12795 [Burkholderiales bacterium]|nr:hypothetical protein [Burkholderiales bacterium]